MKMYINMGTLLKGLIADENKLARQARTIQNVEAMRDHGANIALLSSLFEKLGKTKVLINVENVAAVK
ncbi:MAG: hypothetical protein NTY53_26095 [Kiritimatiellaeota bacterium]|nr:hypothetical protein [Kiritimatiellota bacterium]